jgi:hypothetical protein
MFRKTFNISDILAFNTAGITCAIIGKDLLRSTKTHLYHN